MPVFDRRRDLVSMLLPSRERGRETAGAVVSDVATEDATGDDRIRTEDADTDDETTDREERIERRDDESEATAAGTESGGPDRRGDDADRSRSERADDSSVVEFLDCETVRISGEFDEVIVSLFWWDENGLVGTIAEPVGSVAGERTVAATDEFGTFAYGPIVSGIDAFVEGTPVVPGGGDVSTANPDVDSCIETVREAYDGPGELEEPF